MSSSTAWPGLASINDNSGQNSIDLYIQTPGSLTSTIFYQSTSAEWSSYLGSYTTGNLVKMGVAYQANSAQAAAKGSPGSAGTPASIPTVTQLGVGMNRSNGNQANGWINRMNYLPTIAPSYALPDYTRRLTVAFYAPLPTSPKPWSDRRTSSTQGKMLENECFTFLSLPIRARSKD
jgi:hypothetical protein